MHHFQRYTVAYLVINNTATELQSKHRSQLMMRARDACRNMPRGDQERMAQSIFTGQRVTALTLS